MLGEGRKAHGRESRVGEGAALMLRPEGVMLKVPLGCGQDAASSSVTSSLCPCGSVRFPC